MTNTSVEPPPWTPISSTDLAVGAWTRGAVGLVVMVGLVACNGEGAEAMPSETPAPTVAVSNGQVPDGPTEDVPAVTQGNPVAQPVATPSGSEAISGPSSSPDGVGGAGGAPASTEVEGRAGSGGLGPNGSNAGGAAPVGVPNGSVGGVGGNAGAGPGPSAPVIEDAVTRSDSTFTFQHYPIVAGADGVWTGAAVAGAQATSTTFDTMILENRYLRVTLLPSYGGRVLSIVHKPTNRELLYQNPIGTPYLMFEDIFYYDYLVILGGIFPSFPEPEHGKYWNQPYDVQILSESAEAITVRMSRRDDRDVAAGVPAPYDVGRTDVLVAVDVTLRAGSSRLELTTTLTNTRDSAVPAFEYWTVTTLAPGSEPGQTAIPLNTRIGAAMEQVHLLESSWAWFGQAEQRVSNEVFVWNNLSYFENWVDQGTAFANPAYRANWSGLFNYDAEVGVLRVSDNVQTPGLKLWTFGRGSLDANLADSTEWLRPTIEMWHGITPEFWERGSFAPNEVKQWTESYFATFGLREVTAASEHGAVQLSSSAAGADTVFTALATFTVPDQTINAVLRLDGRVVAEQAVVVSSAEPTAVTATLASAEVSAGAVFEAEFVHAGVSVLLANTTLP